MTANAFSEDVTNAIKAGMNYHLAKPIDIGALMGILSKYLQKMICFLMLIPVCCIE